MTEQILNENEFSLLRLLPVIRRARDFRLYTDKGRLIDLWQNGGAAILGHTPPSMLREIKNASSRGLYAPFPHFLEGRCRKALSLIFPGRNFLFFAAPPPGLEKLIADGTAYLWRPCLNPQSPLAVPEKSPPVLIPVVPGILGWRNNMPLGLCILALDSGFKADVFQTEFLPPVLLAATARGIHDLIAAAPSRANPGFKRIAKALKSGGTGSAFWQRNCIYLQPRSKPSSEEWASLFRLFLDAGFLLPPLASQPVILPGILSPGEEAKLAAILFSTNTCL